jgi:hypothetical protein
MKFLSVASGLAVIVGNAIRVFCITRKCLFNTDALDPGLELQPCFGIVGASFFLHVDPEL